MGAPSSKTPNFSISAPTRNSSRGFIAAWKIERRSSYEAIGFSLGLAFKTFAIVGGVIGVPKGRVFRLRCHAWPGGCWSSRRQKSPPYSLGPGFHPMKKGRGLLERLRVLVLPAHDQVSRTPRLRQRPQLGLGLRL